MIISPLKFQSHIMVLFTISLLLANSAYSKSLQNPKFVELTGTWEYRWGESPVNEQGIPEWTFSDSSNWELFNHKRLIMNPPGRTNEKELWLKKRLPQINWQHPFLYIRDVNLPCDIYIDSKLIHKNSGKSSDYTRRFEWFETLVVPVDTEYQNRYLYIRLYPDDPSLTGFERVFLGPQLELAQMVIKERIHFAILGCLFLVTGLIAVFLFLKHQQQKMILFFGFLSLCIGLMTFGETRTTYQFFSYNSDLLDLFILINPFFLPMWNCLFFEQVFGAGYKKIIRRLWQTHLVYAVFCSLFLISDIFPNIIVRIILLGYFSLFLLSMIVLFVSSIVYAKKGRTEARIITFGFSVLLLFGIYDVVGGAFLVVPVWRNVTYPWGMLVFIICLGLIIERHFTETHKKLQEYSKGLLSKVAERTKDLKEKNDTLQQTLSQLKSTQVQLVQAEKMSSLGHLTAGVAHEINNPIGAIKSNIDLNDSILHHFKNEFRSIPNNNKLDGTERLLKLITLLEKNSQTSHTACDRIIDIVKSLRNFARLDEAEYQRVDVHEGIESTLTLLSSKIRNKIQLIKEYADLPPIHCSPNQLNQVFMNIISNSILAIKENGVITIKTAKQDSQIFIRIKDNGVGIADEHKDKIFEPFYTTRKIGEGRGLGLSLSLGIVEKHNGKIEFTSEQNKGSEFIITLPA